MHLPEQSTTDVGTAKDGGNREEDWVIRREAGRPGTRLPMEDPPPISVQKRHGGGGGTYDRSRQAWRREKQGMPQRILAEASGRVRTRTAPVELEGTAGGWGAEASRAQRRTRPWRPSWAQAARISGDRDDEGDHEQPHGTVAPSRVHRPAAAAGSSDGRDDSRTANPGESVLPKT